ncbi:MAG: 4'-phosphopantetheinyl transferase superfamily protein [Ruminococcus sp.]|nr:4'-phosphopantetheinyl transferase superfamily protein [Ruminococcus sp.]
MTEIYFVNTDNYSLKELNISSLPDTRRAKINRLVHESDKLASACAGLLINKFIGDKDLKLNEYGKPYSDENFFNISHSGNIVIIAVSDFEVGCDVELKRELEYERLGKIVFHENELKKLSETEDKRSLFFKLWTSKEAFIKCLGEGFHFKTTELDLSELSDKLEYRGRTLFFKEYMLKDAEIMLCAEDKNLPGNIIEAEL